MGGVDGVVARGARPFSRGTTGTGRLKGVERNSITSSFFFFFLPRRTLLLFARAQLTDVALQAVTCAAISHRSTSTICDEY